jgi:hypothetical protein
MSNIITAAMIFIFIDSYALKFYTNIQVNHEKQVLGSQSFWDQVNHLNNSDVQTQQSVYQTFYWLNEGILKNKF